MSAERITLRLKSNHEVVLPEATVHGSDIYNWKLRFANDTRLITVSEADWEPVPPPYVLPTGIGAVVRSDKGFVFTRVNDTTWRSLADSMSYFDEFILTASGLTTLSEGVQL